MYKFSKMPNVFAFSSYDRRLLNLIPFNFFDRKKRFCFWGSNLGWLQWEFPWILLLIRQPNYISFILSIIFRCDKLKSNFRQCNLNLVNVTITFCNDLILWQIIFCTKINYLLTPRLIILGISIGRCNN